MAFSVAPFNSLSASCNVFVRYAISKSLHARPLRGSFSANYLNIYNSWTLLLSTFVVSILSFSLLLVILQSLNVCCTLQGLETSALMRELQISHRSSVTCPVLRDTACAWFKNFQSHIRFSRTYSLTTLPLFSFWWLGLFSKPLKRVLEDNHSQ